MADDNSYRASVVIIDASCGGTGKRSVKDDVIRVVFNDDKIYDAFSDGDHTVMLIDSDKKLLLLASY